MGVHGRPQEKDLLDQKPLSMDGFSFGDLGQRVKFFASPLYPDYVETRSRARLLAMQQAETQERREELLASLVASVENLSRRPILRCRRSYAFVSSSGPRRARKKNI